ncbi:Atu2307/SP_0267 family LLM class monooxygenase [Xanthobacter sp. KR7-65]|uniref:Atu2307/SP_0267 family LLM class monooxygenase n=1 Tax=Xanthobacter sp. KR7-65 TaxID=3156612 RepID=UPI0032B4C71E
MQLGVYTFADVGRDPSSGEMVSPGQRLRNLMEEMELADAVGLDVFGLGEHHRADYAVSAPAVALAAGAARTRRIILASAVTVLSSDDPVRVHEQFATLDLLSSGRAEIMAGRGSFIESFPLFGYDLKDYDALFAENLALLLRIRESERVSWPGGHRTAIDGLGVYPRPERRIPVWVAVGGTPQSAARAGSLGLPMALAIIGGEPARFTPLVDLYRRAVREAAAPGADSAVSINSHGFVGETFAGAMDACFPAYAAAMTTIGRERGWPPLTREQFERGTALKNHLVFGTPDQVVEKILYQHELFRHDRFMLQLAVGATPHREVLRAIELYGTKVAPAVRKALGGPTAVPAGGAAPAAATPEQGDRQIPV